MENLKTLSINIKEKIFLGFLYFAVTWVILAMIFGISMAVLEFSGQREITRDLSNWIMWRIDGTFKNSPENIFYNAEDHIWVESVTNEVKMGKLAGNRNLAFGVKNTLEEFLQEKGAIDFVSDRRDLRKAIANALAMLLRQPADAVV